MAEPSWRPCWFDSSETGAPVRNNVAGSKLNVLRGCLKDGFNTRSVTSILVASGIATATAAGHGYSAAQGKLLLVEGAPDAGLNGRVQPLSVTTNNFTYACPGVADGTYTGTITAKRAPLGWTEPHSGTNKAIFQRTAPEAKASMLRIIDTGAAPAAATHAYVTMVSAATDVDTVSNEVPSTDVNQRWIKGTNSATPKQWVIVGDGLWFWLFAPAATDGQFHLEGFGDPESLYPGDATGSMLIFSGSTSLTFGGLLYHPPGDFTPTSGGVSAIHHGPLAGGFGGIAALPAGPGLWGTAGLSGALDVVPITGPYYSKTTTEVRSIYPGLFAPQGLRPFTHLSTVQLAQPSSADKHLLIVSGVRVGGSTLVGQVAIDVAGPWRQ